MELSRRHVLAGSGALAVGAAGTFAAGGAATSAADSATPAAASAALLSAVGQVIPARADWIAAIGATFTATPARGAATELVLESVDDIAGAEAGADYRYSLLFSGDVAEGMHALQSATVGATALTLGIVGTEAGPRAEAVVNILDGQAG